ncbi:MAG: glycosyltransferase family 4 protein [Thermoguttaceae bacterium]
MRIVYLHQHFATPDMAGSTRSYEMARRLVAGGHEVEMVTADPKAQTRGWKTTIEAGIRVHWCSVAYSNHMSFGRRIRSFLDFSWRAACKAASLPCDVVFASSTPLTIALPAAYAGWRRRTPMVFEVRDLWPATPVAVEALKSPCAIAMAKGLERFAYARASHVVALSPDMKEGVVSTGYPAECVSVIPNSCDLALFGVPQETGERFREQYEWLGDRPLVVYTGALGLVNGVDYLARLASAVARVDTEVRFLVIGEGRQREQVRRVAQELKVLDRNFFMLDSVPKKAMPAILSAADMATSTVIDRPPLWANSANKVFDALAAGRPIAINHEGWLADMIRQSGCGLVLPVDDVRAAASELVATLSDRFRLEQAGEAARLVARQRFDREMLARKLEAVILAVGEQRQGRVAVEEYGEPAVVPFGAAGQMAPAPGRRAA